MKAEDKTIREISVNKIDCRGNEERLLYYAVWYDGNQVIDTMNMNELKVLRDIIDSYISEEKGGQQ